MRLGDDEIEGEEEEDVEGREKMGNREDVSDLATWAGQETREELALEEDFGRGGVGGERRRGGREGGGGLLEGRFHEVLRIAAKRWGFGVVGKEDDVGGGMPAGQFRVRVEGATGRTRMDSSYPRRKEGGEGEAKGESDVPLWRRVHGVRMTSHMHCESTLGIRRARSSEPQEASEKGELT